jgi:hypothetical protein
VPQCYRMSGDATVKSIQEQIDQIGSEKVSLVAGIRIVGDGPDMPWEGLKQSLDFTRQQEIAGHCLWFSRGVLEVYPKQLEAYYDVAGKGQANNPFKPRDWRRPPIVATQNGDAFVAQVDRKARFRVIVKRDGRWTETMSREFDAGAHTFVEPGADAVELLIDRRP